MDRSLALYALGTFVAYIVCFKVIEYIIAFMLDDAIVQSLNQSPLMDNLLGIALSTIAFAVAFHVVAIGRIEAEHRTIAIYMTAPFVLIGLIAIGRGIDVADIAFRALFIGIVFKSTELMLSRRESRGIIDIV